MRQWPWPSKSTKPRPTTIHLPRVHRPHLPPEILDHVFGFFNHEDSAEDFLALFSCLLVSKKWNAVAYPRITIESGAVLLKLDSFTDQDAQRLAKLLTRARVLQLPHPSKVEGIICDVRKVLPGAPILQIFQMLSLETLSLGPLELPPLRTLQSRPTPSTPNPELDLFLNSIAAYCEKLAFLHVGDRALSNLHVKRSWMSILERTAPQLEELAFSGITLDNDDLPPISLCTKLKDLRLIGSLHSSHMLASAVECFPNLTSIIFGDFTLSSTSKGPFYDTPNVLLSLAMSCSRLEDLTIVNWRRLPGQDHVAPVASLAHLFSRCRYMNSLTIQHSEVVNDFFFHFLATSTPKLMELNLVGCPKLTCQPITDPAQLRVLARKREWLETAAGPSTRPTTVTRQTVGVGVKQVAGVRSAFEANLKPAFGARPTSFIETRQPSIVVGARPASFIETSLRPAFEVNLKPTFGARPASFIETRVPSIAVGTRPASFMDSKSAPIIIEQKPVPADPVDDASDAFKWPIMTTLSLHRCPLVEPEVVRRALAGCPALDEFGLPRHVVTSSNVAEELQARNFGPFKNREADAATSTAVMIRGDGPVSWRDIQGDNYMDIVFFLVSVASWPFLLSALVVRYRRRSLPR
ncbi:hypothetical protein BC938DRAFT_483424 [Jimgerdemannia flammicorona]|uniref:F-box domain-containing protein n=1 Tax=Jimgerdemannia flammicorona TaxID=994334 RepID=A0A433QVN4_9FUNG|nr:hypothetical protein BC938DRAFT_483424 [Jimgerdemannia flammicorona]